MMRKNNKEKYYDIYKIPEEINFIYGSKKLDTIDKISNILFYIIMLEIGFFIGLILGGIIK